MNKYFIETKDGGVHEIVAAYMIFGRSTVYPFNIYYADDWLNGRKKDKNRYIYIIFLRENNTKIRHTHLRQLWKETF